MVRQFPEGAAVVGLKHFTDFTDDAGWTLGAQEVAELPQAAGNPVRGFVKSNGAGLFQPFLHARLTPFFLWNKAFKNEAITGKSACNDGGYQGGGTGERFHHNAGGDASPDEKKTRITDAGCPGVAY